VHIPTRPIRGKLAFASSFIGHRYSKRCSDPTEFQWIGQLFSLRQHGLAHGNQFRTDGVCARREPGWAITLCLNDISVDDVACLTVLEHMGHKSLQTVEDTLEVHTHDPAPVHRARLTNTNIVEVIAFESGEHAVVNRMIMVRQ
jgi:hypothetical protein